MQPRLLYPIIYARFVPPPNTESPIADAVAIFLTQHLGVGTVFSA